MAEAALKRMTVEEFLAWCDQQDGRFELVDGQPRPVFPLERRPGEAFAMAGPTGEHQEIQDNVLHLVRRRLAPPCWALSTFAVRVASDRTREPDVVVSCTRRERGDRMTSTPTLIVEVLSASTQSVDLAEKLPEYKDLATVQEIWLISSTRRWAQIWRRRADGGWRGDDHIGSGLLATGLPGGEIAIDEIYLGVEL